MDDRNPLSALTPRSTFLDQTISSATQHGPSALAIFNYAHDSWKEAADIGGHAGSDAALTAVITRLQTMLPRTCAIAALDYFTFATMLTGASLSDHRKLVVEAVKHVNSKPIEWKGLTLSAPRVVEAVVMAQGPETITPAALIYEAASQVFSPAAPLMPERVSASIYREGNWHAFDERLKA